MDQVPFFTNLQCDSALPWPKLIQELEIGLTRFSNGQIEQPVRAMLDVKEHSGFLGRAQCTVLKIQDFCITQILREINFEDS